MRILGLFSWLFGYNFFVRVNSLVNYFISVSLNRRLRKVDGFAKFEFPVRAIGLNYIEIGLNFSSGKGLRIQAIEKYANWKYHPSIVIGNNVIVNPNCQIVAVNKIVIGNDVLIASNVFISDHSHGESNFSDIDVAPALRKLDTKGEIIIGNNVWIGQNVSILANVKIGANTIIGANSVVTKDIPSYCVAVGIPAKVIKELR